MARRANQSGSISYSKSRKRFRARVSLHTPDGPARKELGYYKTRASAQEAITEALSRYGQRIVTLDAEKITLGEYLNDWLSSTARHNVGSDTWRTYEHEIRNYLQPASPAQVILAETRPMHVRLIKQELLDRNLAEATVTHALGVLSTALNQAVADELIPSNPSRNIRRPKKRGESMRILSEDQVRALLRTVAGSRHEALYQVAVKLGPRQGELAALMWEDVDFERHTLTIRRSVQTRFAGESWSATKSGAERVIVLPPTIEAGLRRHRQMQNEARLASPYWENSSLVFPNTRGAVYRRWSIHEDFKKLLQKAELPDIRFHDLRHTSITHLLRAGVDIRTTADIVGHADPAITLRRYSHVLEGMKQRAAEVVDNYPY